MTSLSQKGQVGLPLLTPPEITSALGAQISSSDNDLELKLANYGLWAKLGLRSVFIWPAEL